MTIKFLRVHEVEGESFKFRQEVKDRSPESEMHFVRRGHAVFVRDGKYYDHEDREVPGDVFKAAAEPEKAAAASRPARERRAAPRAMTGTAPSAGSKAGKPAKAGTAKKGQGKGR